MAQSHKRLGSRTFIVLIWFIGAGGFLAWQRPNFWRSPFLHYEEARTLASDHRGAEALAEVDRAIVEDPGNAGYLIFKGYLELGQAQGVEAERSFSAVLSTIPADVEARLGLAEALAQQDRHAESLRALAPLDGQPLTIEQRYRKSALQALSKDFSGALKDHALLDRDVTDPMKLREGLRWAMAAEDWPRATSIADRILERMPSVAVQQDVTNEKAIALRAQGRLQEALALFEEYPTGQNLTARAEICLQIEDYSRAAELCRLRVDEQPGNAEPLRQLAYALEKSGQRQTAVKAYQSALQREDDLHTRLQLVMLLNTLHRYDEAWTALASVPRPSRDPQVLRLQASTAFWSGHVGEAADLFARLPTTTAADIVAQRDLGFELAQRGDDAGAERLYRRLLDKRDDTATRERLAQLLNSQQRYDESWQVVSSAAPSGPDAQQDSLRELQARTAFWAARYDDAIPRLRDHLSRRPDDTDAWRDLAEAARQVGDHAEEMRALTEYLQRAPADLSAAERRAMLLEQGGRTDEAMAAYAAIVERDPTRAGIARTVGMLSQQAGLTADALRYQTLAWEHSTAPDPDLTLNIARLHRVSGDPKTALVWYDRYAQALPPDSRRTIVPEMGWTAIEAGDPALARRVLEPLVTDPSATAPELVVAARAATNDGDPTAAIRLLERTAAQRSLSTDEQTWLAGLYRETGDRTRALAMLESIVVNGGRNAAALEAIGDMRWDQHEYEAALNAYLSARSIESSSSLTLKTARAQAALGRFRPALALYDAYLQVMPPSGVRLELARTSLAAGEFVDAEHWARDAVASDDERKFAANILLAEALHLQGRAAESRAVVDDVPEGLRQDPQALELFGHLAAARDEHLLASRLFASARENGAANPGELWYWSAASSFKRGDLGRASSSLDRARTSGETPMLEPLLRSEVGRLGAPAVGLPVQVLGDSNDLTLAQAGVQVSVRPAPAIPLVGEFSRGRLSQHGVSFDRTRGTIGLANAWPTPHLGLQGALGTEDYGRAGRRVVGRADFAYEFDDRSTVGGQLFRESLWSAHDVQDPRQFNRVIDLPALGPAFTLRGVRGYVDKMVGVGRSARVDLGGDWYQDGNMRAYGYGHYQIVTTDRPGVWTAVAPTMSWESYRNSSPLYFSPDRFVSIGGLYHTIRTTDAWTLDAEVNPKLAWLRSDKGINLHGSVDLRRQWGRVSAGVNGFLMYDRPGDYVLWRVGGQLGVRVGR